MSDNKDFFEESEEQSQVKSAIVSKYFSAWANVVLKSVQNRGGEIRYRDLFCGPGRYIDGTKSTPLLVLDKAIESEKIGRYLRTVFCDSNPGFCDNLKKELSAYAGIENLYFAPFVDHSEVNEEIAERIGKQKNPPTLTFFDPWGYKGLSIKLVQAAIKDWGCDCIFFFNYNRINMDIDNQNVKKHMDQMFGETAADELRKRLKHLKPKERENEIVETLAEELNKSGGKYVLPFRFRNSKGKRTSHHLVFVSKHVLGYTIMKDIMAKESRSKKSRSCCIRV